MFVLKSPNIKEGFHPPKNLEGENFKNFRRVKISAYKISLTILKKSIAKISFRLTMWSI